MASTGDTRRTAAAALGAGAATTIGTTIYFGWSSGDYDIAVRASDYLLAGGLDVYAVIPEAQMGPLALLLAALPYPVYVALTCLLAGAFVALALAHQRVTRWAAAAVVLVGLVWYRYALTGHVDDALVLLGVAGIVSTRERRGPWWAMAAWWTVAIAAKPTAALFLPLAFLHSRRAGLAAVAVTALIWAPFALADLGGFLAAGGGIVDVSTHSLLGLLGVEGDYPSWVRPVQLVGAWWFCWAMGRRNVAAAVVAAMAWRVLLEPGAYPAYAASLMAVGLMLDARSWRIPVVTLLAAWAWVLSSFPPVPTSDAVLRLVVVAAALGVSVVAWRRSLRRGPHLHDGGSEDAADANLRRATASRVVPPLVGDGRASG